VDHRSEGVGIGVDAWIAEIGAVLLKHEMVTIIDTDRIRADRNIESGSAKN
jgi:hypothetical protein